MARLAPTDVPVSMVLRLVLILYRAKWFVRPLLRQFGFRPKMSWKEVMCATRQLAPALSAYNPDLIIGVGVGGTIWAAILAGNLSDKSFVGIDREVTWSGGSREVRMTNMACLEEIRERITGKRILLVSGEIRSGQTLTLFKNHIKSFDPLEIRAASLDYSNSATARPEYYYLCSQEVIQKPWRELDTYTNPDNGARPD